MATLHAQGSKWKNELLPNIVDHISRDSPEALYAEYPISPQSYVQGYRKIPYRDLANAVNGAARWLSETLGPSQNHEVLTYVGPNDLRYIVLVLAAVKAGYVLFLTSPRNSIAAHVKLFERLNCTKLLSPEPRPTAVQAILEKHRMQHVAVPTISELLDEKHAHYVYDKKYEDARSEPFMIIHSSGSTGFPKPLIYTNETAARNMNMLAEDPPSGIRSMDRLVQGKRVLNCFPPFHGACLVSHLFAAIPFGTVMIGPLAEAISTAQGLADALHQTPADLAFLVPSIVLELSQDDKLLEYCSRNLERCLYAGGDLPQAVGDKVAAKLPLVCQYGASEIGLTPQLLPETMGTYDWKYVYFHPCLGTEFKEIADGNYELCVKYDRLKETEQPTFTLFPDLKEYRSRDLFKPHPRLPDLWGWCARADDIIVFLNGEKTNPISMEQHIVARNAEVLTAIVIGAQRFQAALLLEPAANIKLQNTAEEAAFIERAWSSIQEANAMAPAHARIEKALILPMSKDKPVIRAGKGTIQRTATLRQYVAEVEKLYQNADMDMDDAIDDVNRSADIESPETLSQIVGATINRVLEKPELGQHDNFFHIGLDSLQALTITRTLRKTLRITDIAVATVYSNPSVALLSKAVHDLQVSRNAGQKEEQQLRAQRVTSLLDEFQRRIHEIPKPVGASSHGDRISVVLTGSTGTFGTYLLSALVDDPTVDHIYCLNRRDGAREIQVEHRDAVGLSQAEIDSKISFLKADLAQPDLGLAISDYVSIQKSVTAIIHNAWPVNFNIPLDAFRPQLDGVLNLLSLSASGTHLPRFFFVSSISSVFGHHTPSRVTPEEILRGVNAPLPIGYAESKFISEVLCDEANRHLGIPISLARVGQVAGPVRQAGIWNSAEWVPSLILSSVHVGALPDSLGASLDTVNWIPVDLLAETIVGFVTQAGRSDQGTITQLEPGRYKTKVLHVQNPQATTWSALLPGIASTLETLTSKPITVIPSSLWLARVRQGFEQIAEGDDEKELATTLKQNPAIKLLDFFAASMSDQQGTNRLAQDETLAQSSFLRAVNGVSKEWMDKWINEWLSAGE